MKLEDMTLKQFKKFQKDGAKEREAELYGQLCNHHWRYFHEELEDGTIHTSDESRAFAKFVYDFMEQLLENEKKNNEVPN